MSIQICKSEKKIMVKNILIKSQNHNITLLTNGVENPKKIVLSLHGFNGDAWGNGFSKLRKRFDDILVCSFDCAGHGESEVDAIDMSVELIDNEIKSVLDYLQKTYPNVKIVILASSYGGYRTICALNHKKISGVSQFVFLNPAFKMLKIMEIIREFDYNTLPEGSKLLMKNGTEKYVSKRFLDEIHENDLYAQKYENPIPLTMFLGKRDSLVPTQDSIEFSKIYPCQIVYLDEEHSFEYPESWDMVATFLKNC